MEKYQYDPKVKTDMESSPIPYAVYQLVDGQILTLIISEGFLDLFGFKNRETAYMLMDKDMYRSAHPEDAARIADIAYLFAKDGGNYDVVYRTKTLKSSDYRIVHAQGKRIHADTGEPLSVVWYTDEGAYDPKSDGFDRNLTSLYNQTLRDTVRLQVNYYDSLTGLPNMTYFFQFADSERERIRKRREGPAILFIDLNGMRYFNRKYGFTEGNKLLREMGSVFSAFFGNSCCCRIAQDHFAVITSTRGLNEILEKVLFECSRINGEKNVPVRIGVYPDIIENVTISTACDRAKAACDIDRKAYKSGYRYFNETMLKTAEKQQHIINNLDRALAEKWVKVYYQPIIRAANGEVCNEEALARWIDPEKGMISPADFIPYLEDSKLIYKLDLYIIEETLKKMNLLTEKGMRIVPCSVNLSRYDFESCDMVEEIRKRVDEAGVDRKMLKIEITESVVGSSFEMIKQQVDRFHALGFDVWMDDFGSGYSSLDVLQSIHFDLIKLDMRFMQQFNNEYESRVILTELIKMAIGLGIDSIAEGVEKAEQIDFLREVGCTKLQGFYYSKPLPMEAIMESYENGLKIGFENPLEAEYYAALGRINLYDMTSVTRDDQLSLHNYFDTLPMGIIESDGEQYSLLRANNTYRNFLIRMFGTVEIGKKVSYPDYLGGPGGGFLSAMRQCGLTGDRMLIDEEFPDGSTVHAFVRRIAVNPVNGIAALGVIVLAVMDKNSGKSGTTYADIAKALSSDYAYLYYVDLTDDQFVEYTSNAKLGELAVERHGTDFFRQSRLDSGSVLYGEDADVFTEAFTKENILNIIDEQGSFVLTYRQFVNNVPTYMNLKAVRMQNNSNYLIIGVNNIDAQMKQKEAMNRMQREQITYQRIAALSGEYICIYIVDPETDHYSEYGARKGYETLGLAREGEDFFNTARKNADNTICPDDLDKFMEHFTKEEVMRDIDQNGIYGLQYRLIIDGKARWVNLKAAVVMEKEGPRIIVGINDIDARLRRDSRKEQSLAELAGKLLKNNQSPNQ